MIHFSSICEYFIFCMLAMELKVCSGGSNLDDYILHYEELNYDSAVLHQRHLRSKRSTEGTVHLAFDAFGRNFKLRLHRDTSVFTPEYMMREDGTLKNVDLSFLHTGDVVGIPGSKVDGAIIQGMFRGEIHIPGDTAYHTEVNNRFNKSQLSAGYHSVIYRDKDLNFDPYRGETQTEMDLEVDSADTTMHCIKCFQFAQDDMIFVEDRLLSFMNWPNQLTPDKYSLEKAGFHYTGQGDCTTCFACNVKLRH